MLFQECVIVAILVTLTVVVCSEKLSRLNLKSLATKMLGKCCPFASTESKSSDGTGTSERTADESTDASKLLDASIEVDDALEGFKDGHDSTRP
jgi:hypothetical protein